MVADARQVKVKAVWILTAPLVLVPVRSPIRLTRRLQVNAVALATKEDFVVVELPGLAEVAPRGELACLRLLLAKAAFW